MITLQKNSFFQKGSERTCYLHPNNEDLIIKIVSNQKNSNNQNDVEEKYYSYLEKEEVSFSNLAKFYGLVDTNLGKGLVFERVRNFDKTESPSLRDCLVNKLLSTDEESSLLDDLESYLIQNNILFIDSTSVNILVKKIDTNKKKLIIIDGIGAKRDGFKFKLYLLFPFYAKYKIQKQWKVFLENIKRVKRKIELNQKL